MTTPAEGPGTQGGTETTMQLSRADLLQMLQNVQTEQRERETARARSLGGRLRKWGPIVGTGAAAATIASDEGQEAIGTAADAAVWTGGELVDAGQWAGGEIADFGRWAGTQASEFGQWAGQQLDAAGQAISDFSGWAVESTVNAWNNGWAAAGDLAQQVGGSIAQAGTEVYNFASQYVGDLSSNPNHLVTAAIVAGGAALATERGRQAFAQAASAASRWGKAAASAALRPAETARKVYNAVRSNPTVQSALQSAGATASRIHQAVSRTTPPAQQAPQTGQQAPGVAAEQNAGGPGQVPHEGDVRVAGGTPQTFNPNPAADPATPAAGSGTTSTGTGQDGAKPRQSGMPANDRRNQPPSIG